ncbi:nucleotide sugar dehydrogenase [Gammaproteobacteria bacterium]|nr:nucleotide sugar dehydrogenase [Gammaproteobacteria bacterium]
MKVIVVGLGYVGLTLSVYMANKGLRVFGLDNSDSVISSLEMGKAHFYEADFNDRLSKSIKSGNFTFGKSLLGSQDEEVVYIVTVGTPIVDSSISTDALTDVLALIAKSLKCNDSVILRSTIQVGCTRAEAKPILDTAGVDYRLGFCPERTLEGKAFEELASLPQIVSGIDPDSLSHISNFFKLFTNEIVIVNSVEEAEIVKLLNNSERDLRFAIGNEVALMCEAFGISASNVIRAANFKYNRSDLKLPGPVGGPCLEKDPYILTNSFSDQSYSPKMFVTGRQINESIISSAANRIFKRTKNKINPNICVLGMAFKGVPVTGDVRGSTAKQLVIELRKLFKNGSILGHDYLATNEDILSCGVDSVVADLVDIINNVDIIIAHNNHPTYATQIPEVLNAFNNEVVLYDFWNQLGTINNNIVDHCIFGEGKEL